MEIFLSGTIRTGHSTSMYCILSYGHWSYST